MNVNVHTKHTVPNPDSSANERQKVTIVNRIEKSLKHVASTVRDVEVYIEDESPGSSKFQGRCRITVHFDKGQPITVEGQGENFGETLADGVAKVQQVAETNNKKRIEKKRRVTNMRE